jgi:hypothetical protein
MDNLKSVIRNKVSRRRFITGVSAGMGAAAAVSLAAGCGGGNSTTTAPTTAPTTSSPSGGGVTDADILNFALNLEYLEAEFYLAATTGSGLATADIGTAPGTVTGGAAVPWQTYAIRQYAMEIAQQEMQHVQDLRALITEIGGTPVDRPTIDFTNAFNAAAAAAMIPGGVFNPFDNENDFVLGSFVFEDVGVTAYHGAGTLITDKTKVLPAAGGIQAVEAYHAATIRSLLVGFGGAYVTNANLISTLRGAASAVVTGGTGAAETMVSASTIVAADSNSIAYDRNTDQVLHIVYLNATAGVVKSGGFYPNGMNGTISATAS